MKHTYKRLLLAAPKSGSGKTMMTCGLLQALKNRELNCCAFKCGPDYIDPMFHKYVLGIDGGNLDTYFLSPEQVQGEFMSLAGDAEISVIEGVMGYYDGVGGDTVQASSYEVACAVNAPVVLVLDCKGASLSLAAVVKGFLEYKADSHVRGVILNRISPVIAERLKPAMEELGITVYGYLPECEEGKITSRHLGLVMPEEIIGLQSQLNNLAARMEESVDIQGLIRLASEAEPLEPVLKTEESGKVPVEKIKIGVAEDEAFCFYYQENLKLLESFGARLVPFSPMRDEKLPEGICGLLFGGGYPELYAEKLWKNESMRSAVRQAAGAGIPILAECGGFLYLHEELEVSGGMVYPMAGVIAGRAFPTKKLSRFGYIEMKPEADLPLLMRGESIRGHEFHYWESTNPGSDITAKKPGRDTNWSCIHGEGTLFAGFPHLYYPSNPAFIERWLKQCITYNLFTAENEAEV